MFVVIFDGKEIEETDDHDRAFAVVDNLLIDQFGPDYEGFLKAGGRAMAMAMVKFTIIQPNGKQHEICIKDKDSEKTD